MLWPGRYGPPHNIQAGITNILGIESVRKGVEVSKSEDGLVIDVHVIIGYGIKISEVATNVMQKVRYVLENSAALPVAAVNVNVKGIRVLRDFNREDHALSLHKINGYDLVRCVKSGCIKLEHNRDQVDMLNVFRFQMEIPAQTCI